MKYRQEFDNAWFQPARPLWLMGCCDCGLVHRVNFRIRRGKIQMRATRDARRTGQKRRHKDLLVTLGLDKAPKVQQ